MSRKSMQLMRRNIGYMCRLGSSAFLCEVAIACMMFVGNQVFIHYLKEDGVAAFSIACYFFPIIFMVYNAIAQSAQPIISYNFGANNPERVRKGFRLLLLSSVIYAACIWAVAELLPGVFVTIFTNDLQLAEFARWAMRIYMAAVVLMGAQIACQQTFIAFGNSKISAFLAMFRKIIVLIPLIYILPVFLEDNVQAVFLAEPIADVIAVATTLILFRKNFKKVLAEMKQKSETQDI